MNAAKKVRRQHRTQDMKARIIRAYDRAPHGSKGDVLERYKVSVQFISDWKAGKAFDLSDAEPAPEPEPAKAPRNSDTRMALIDLVLEAAHSGELSPDTARAVIRELIR